MWIEYVSIRGNRVDLILSPSVISVCLSYPPGLQSRSCAGSSLDSHSNLGPYHRSKMPRQANLKQI